MGKEHQIPLFPLPEEPSREVPKASSLSAHSPLALAMEGFQEYMVQQEFTENTIKSFLGDLRILGQYVGAEKEIGRISTKDLNDFLTYLLRGRGVPCTSKSYARRVTTLKVFFGWLAREGIIPQDPAAPIVHRPASSPLPRILYDDQVERVLQVTETMMRDPEDPDPRPHLLVTLLLETGIKKAECMRIELADIDTSDPAQPVLYVRYANPRMRYKERKLRLPRGWPTTLRFYRERYQPKKRLFECTARNLEYVLANVAKRAGLPAGLSFEMLRMTCAVREYKKGMEPDKLRKKLGLSPITWQEMLEKIERLVEPAL